MSRKVITFPTIPPRVYQLPFWKAVDNGIRRIILSYPRRGGKDLTSAMFLAREAMRKPGTYWILAPTKTWAARIYWSGISEIKFKDPVTGKMTSRKGSILDIAVPAEVRKKTNHSEYTIYLHNGSKIILGGTDEGSFVGQTGNGFILSEYSLHKEGVLPLINPIITESGGWMLVNGTQREPDNQLNRLIESTQDNRDWYTIWCGPEQIKTYYWVSPPNPETGEREFNINPELEGKRDPITKVKYENIQDLVDVEPWKKVIYQREYLNIPLAVEEGSYYEKQLKELEENNRITDDGVYFDSNKPVYTAWDLGMNDSTSIVFFQLDEEGNPIIIDFYDDSGHGVGHYIQMIKHKPYVYGNHLVPIDASRRSYQLGTDLVEFCRQTFNFKMQKLPKTMSLRADIELVRDTLPRCRFLKSNTVNLVKSLYAYSENPNTGKPSHNDASHASDAFRYMCVAINAGLAKPILNDRYRNSLPNFVDNYTDVIIGWDDHWDSNGLPMFTE